MWSNFRSWYLRNQNSITWFLIGFLIAGALYSFSIGAYEDAVLSLLMAWVNYILNQK